MAKHLMWNCRVYDSAKGGYVMIIGRYLLTLLGLNISLSEHAIKTGDGHLKGPTATMVDLGVHEFKDLNTEKLHPRNHL